MSETATQDKPRRGRPKGSKNKPKTHAKKTMPAKRPSRGKHLQAIDKALKDIAGGASTREALATHKVDRKLYYQLVNDSEELRNQYARARMGQAQHYADKLLEIATDVLEGKTDPQAARAAADIIKWTAARILPHTYGDRQQVDVTVDAGGSLAEHLAQRIKAIQADVLDV